MCTNCLASRMCSIGHLVGNTIGRTIMNFVMGCGHIITSARPTIALRRPTFRASRPERGPLRGQHLRAERRLVLGAALTGVALLGPAGSATAAGAATFALRPGMVVTRNGVSAVVPPRGEGAGAEAWLSDGGSISLTVQTGIDGHIVITAARTSPAVALAAPPAASVASSGGHATIQGSPPACQDATYHLTSSWWRTSVHWLFQASSTPTNMSHSAAQKAIKSGASHITHAFNDCGRADHVSAASRYAGVTGASPNISSSSVCQNRDGRNVVGFGDLPAGQLGYTCLWYQGGSRTVEADIKLNKQDFSWTTSTVGCSNQYLVQAVATHQFGWAFGLANVSEASQTNLTMSTTMFFCDSSPSTLGLGDMRGLEARY